MRERPDLKNAWSCLDQWFQHTGDALSFFDIRLIARDCRDVPATQLVLALQYLVDKGVLRQVYRVADPQGLLLEKNYPSLKAIPTRVRDRLDKPFDTAEGEIVPGFESETSSVER